LRCHELCSVLRRFGRSAQRSSRIIALVHHPSLRFFLAKVGARMESRFGNTTIKPWQFMTVRGFFNRFIGDKTKPKMVLIAIHGYLLEL
jgi:hypothetical protein